MMQREEITLLWSGIIYIFIFGNYSDKDLTRNLLPDFVHYLVLSTMALGIETEFQYSAKGPPLKVLNKVLNLAMDFELALEF